MQNTTSDCHVNDGLSNCPKCADGGKVRLVAVPNPASAVFDPLPKGERATVLIQTCECGWTQENHQE